MDETPDFVCDTNLTALLVSEKLRERAVSMCGSSDKALPLYLGYVVRFSHTSRYKYQFYIRDCPGQTKIASRKGATRDPLDASLIIVVSC